MQDERAVLDFWFGPPDSPEHGSRREVWFKKDASFDDAIRTRFLDLWEQADRGELEGWHERPRSLLALIVLCDQFPRNMFRGDARAFATDARAREAAGAMIGQGWDSHSSLYERAFVYLPFEHAESLADQERSVALFAGLRGSAQGDEYHDYALRHRDVIARFGRFPHRNAALGRTSTPEEEAFLRQPGSGF